MRLSTVFQDYQVDIFDDTQYAPYSADNPWQYKKFYSDKEYDDYLYLTRHGIQLFKDQELISSACLAAGGGSTSVHETGMLVHKHKLYVCCGNNIFCLTFPDLDLVWRTQADDATCFGIFNYKDDLIVHGELAITRLDQNGQIIWQFNGSDIFTTPNGSGTFEIHDNTLKAISWDGITYTLDIDNGVVLNYKSTHQQ